jgi:hypothetical protein
MMFDFGLVSGVVGNVTVAMFSSRLAAVCRPKPQHICEANGTPEYLNQPLSVHAIVSSRLQYEVSKLRTHQLVTAMYVNGGSLELFRNL